MKALQMDKSILLVPPEKSNTKKPKKSNNKFFEGCYCC